jgi:hypothetical protein
MFPKNIDKLASSCKIPAPVRMSLLVLVQLALQVLVTCVGAGRLYTQKEFFTFTINPD